jgi:hypothetical protein
MNQSQTEMLTTKSAVEQTVRGLITSYSKLPLPNPYGLYGEICRYMASLYDSQRIDANYRVEREVDGKFLVSFAVRGQPHTMTFMPPVHTTPSLATPIEKFIQSQEPLGAEFEKVLFDNLDDLYETTSPDSHNITKKFTQ